MCLAPVEIKGYHEHSGIGIYRNYHTSCYILVPCGKCIECVKDRQNAWFVRTYYQFLNTKGSVYFVTLTYDNKHISQKENGYTLNKSDVQKWFKRARRTSEYHNLQDGKISYFLAGEYGKKTFRPHYHLLLFGVEQKLLNIMLEDWQQRYGFTSCKRVGRSSVDIQKVSRYLSKYSTKQYFNRDSINKFCDDNELQRPFICASIGYGALNIEQTKVLFNHILNNSHTIAECIDRCEFNIPVNGFKYKIPSYIKKKLQYEKVYSFTEWCYNYLLFQDKDFINFLPRSWGQYFTEIARLRAYKLLDEKLQDLSESNISNYSREQRLHLQERIRKAVSFETSFKAKQSLEDID